jgi:hypothetical protein
VHYELYPLAHTSAKAQAKKMKKLHSILMAICLVAAVACGGLQIAHANTTDDATYGAGSYGGCAYGSCTITLSGGSTTNVDVIPSSSGKCTVKSDTVSVLTDSPAGYSLTMTTTTTNNALTGPSSISASNGTSAAPVTLAMNTWGYRVDGLGSFGAGPTNTQTNGSVPSVTFAGVPASNQSAAQIAYSASPANPAANTTVWYGVCANASLLAGNYAATVTYTAVVN